LRRELVVEACRACSVTLSVSLPLSRATESANDAKGCEGSEREREEEREWDSYDEEGEGGREEDGDGTQSSRGQLDTEREGRSSLEKRKRWLRGCG